MTTFSPVVLSRASCWKERPLWASVRMLVYLGFPCRGSGPSIVGLGKQMFCCSFCCCA